MLREGRHVPLAVIAGEAGVGVGTLYRSFADREALLHALEYRAYGLLNQILDEVSQRDIPGLGAVREFLAGTLAIGDQLILPLHGAPPLVSDRAVHARQEINRRLDRFIERGQADGSIRAAVTATDVIVFSALITQPLPHGPGLAADRRAPARDLRERARRDRPGGDAGSRGDPRGHRGRVHAPRRSAVRRRGTPPRRR